MTNSDSVIITFKFPDEMRILCQQYLLYFPKFLEDLGIKAIYSLEEKSELTIFSVSPVGAVAESLDKIREALAVYLNLPDSPILYDDSFASMRLQQQIENLQHAQRLAISELHLTEKLLIAKSDAIFQQKTIDKQKSIQTTESSSEEDFDFDFFISHASEDKEEIVRPLAEKLIESGFKVWYDEFQLKIGDSLRRSIDKGLKKSRYGIVVLSPSFFKKEWTNYELDALVQRQMNGEKAILPLWHKVSKNEVMKYSASLVDIVSLNTTIMTIDELVSDLALAISNKLNKVLKPLNNSNNNNSYTKVMINAVENKVELEEIYDGLKIGESKFLKEQLGIHLNPAKVIKTVVKNTLGKNEKKSELGLKDEE